MSDITKACLDFAFNLKYDDTAPNTREQMKKYIFDLICCAVAGSKTKDVEAFKYLCSLNNVENGVKPLQLKEPTSLYYAALLNGASGHALEMDDSDRTGLSHPGVMIITPALLSGYLCLSTGKELLTACIAGYEIMLRVGTALGLPHYALWHTTGTTGPLGAVIAAGKLFNLNRIQLGHAFGNAGTLCSGLWEFNATRAQSKILHVGHGVADALMVCQLAKQNFTGADKILEGKQGLFRGFHEEDFDKGLFEDFGLVWRSDTVSFKPYPCCRHTHGGIDAGLTLHKQLADKSLKKIKEIQIETYQAAFDVVGNNTVSTIKDAKFSLPFTVCSAIIDGDVSDKSFTEESITNSLKQSLLRKCKISVSSDILAIHPFHEQSRVTLTLESGEILSAFIADPLGEPETPLTWDDLFSKAKTLLPDLPVETIRELQNKIRSLEETDTRNLYEFMHALSLH